MIFTIRLIARFLAWLPISAALRVGEGLGWIMSTVVRHRRVETVSRIRECLPDRSPQECVAIYRGMFANLGMNIVEVLRVCHLGHQDFIERTTLHGEEHLAGLQEHRLVLMAHIGNWENCGFITTRIATDCSVVVKMMKNPSIQSLVQETREKMNLHVLPHNNSFRECLRRLKNGGGVAIILDQNRGQSQGVFVDFFGKPACTTPGLALLSYKTGRDVYPLFDVRRNRTEHDLYLLPPIAAPESRNVEALTEATQVYTTAIETMIRKHPEQWTWLHRRWRTSPPPPDPIGEGTGPEEPESPAGP